CIYCYARPSHAYLDLSPGLDFETRLYAKENAPQLLRRELSRAGYEPRLIAMGTNTDPYQPIEKRLRITAGLLEVFDEFNHPVSITTKSSLITRDIPLLARLARRNLVRVQISIGTLDRELAKIGRASCREKGQPAGSSEAENTCWLQKMRRVQ